MNDDRKVGGIVPGDSYISALNPDGKDHKRKRHKRRKRDEVADHFEELQAAAELAHDLLEKQGSPFRFCVYRDEGHVFLDLVLLDEDGSVKETKKRDITHQEFTTWITAIEEGEGLFFSDIS